MSSTASQRHNNKDAHRKTSLTKYVPLTLFVRVRKGLLRVCVWEGVGDRTETVIFWPPLLWPSALSLSCSPDAQPEAQRPTLLGDGFLYCILSASSPDLNSSGPQGPSAWCGFPYHTSSITPSPTGTATGTGTVLTSVLTELYNSSTPTRSLKSHVWLSSSGNNCHAAHRSLSSGASVYECTMGMFYLVPFHQPISAHAIFSHNCH